MGVEETKALEIAIKLTEVGFFELRGSKEDPYSGYRFFIATLFRWCRDRRTNPASSLISRATPAITPAEKRESSGAARGGRRRRIPAFLYYFPCGRGRVAQTGIAAAVVVLEWGRYGVGTP
jgi:hypothetical protein